MNDSPHIFICAGEPSGDLIGSLLAKELKRIRPEARLAGIGGDNMEEAGVDVQFNIVRDLAIIGIVEVITNSGQILRLMRDTKKYLREKRPDILVVIDYPGFNLRMAGFAHGLGIKVIYYVIPQIWAWHRSRIKKIREYVDRAIPILPFEEKFLRDEGVEAKYIGHPLLDIMKLTMDRDEVFRRFEFDPKKKLVALLPGSRKGEVEKLFPVMLEAAEKIEQAYPDVQFVLPKASTLPQEQIDRILSNYSVDVKVVEAFRYNVRAATDFAIVASGTATLETGILGCPMLIVYKIAYPTWLIGKMIVKVPYIGLINIVAGDLVAQELLQDQCTAENVANQCVRILSDPEEVERIKYQLGVIKEKLGGAGASRRAAETVYEVLEAEPEQTDSKPLLPSPA